MDSKALRVVAIADKIVSKMIFLFFVALFIASSYAVYDSIRVHDDAHSADDVANSLGGYTPHDRISHLRAMNPEVIGWIALDDTKIDHPILQTGNNSYYLTHDYKKDYSLGGSIFIDYRNSMSDDYFVYYGHNIDNGSMLGRINEYSDKDFFDNHLAGTLYYEDGSEHSFTVIAFAYKNEQDNTVYDVSNLATGHNNEIYSTVTNAATRINSSANSTYKKLVLLSTCTEANGERAVLLLGYDE